MYLFIPLYWCVHVWGMCWCISLAHPPALISVQGLKLPLSVFIGINFGISNAV